MADNAAIGLQLSTVSSQASARLRHSRNAAGVQRSDLSRWRAQPNLERGGQMSQIG